MMRSRSASAAETNQSRSVAFAASLPTAKVSLARTVALNSSMSSSRSGASDNADGKRAANSPRLTFVGIQSRPCQFLVICDAQRGLSSSRKCIANPRTSRTQRLVLLCGKNHAEETLRLLTLSEIRERLSLFAIPVVEANRRCESSAPAHAIVSCERAGPLLFLQQICSKISPVGCNLKITSSHIGRQPRCIPIVSLTIYNANLSTLRFHHATHPERIFVRSGRRKNHVRDPVIRFTLLANPLRAQERAIQYR